MFAETSKQHKGLNTKGSCCYNLDRSLATDSFTSDLETGLEALSNDSIKTIDLKVCVSTKDYTVLCSIL